MICIIIPCYNEALRLRFAPFSDCLAKMPSVHFCFVNDGSWDDTARLLNDFAATASQRVRVVHLASNSGKAEAVRQGVLHLKNERQFEIFGYWDADLSSPLGEIGYYLKHMTDGVRMVMASRLLRLGATVQRNATRHYFGRIFATFASIVLKLPVYDTQCGAKLFRKELAVLFEEAFITSWLFDVEILARYRNLIGRKELLKRVVEVPVNTWIERPGTKIRFSHVLRLPFEFLAIGRKYNKH